MNTYNFCVVDIVLPSEWYKNSPIKSEALKKAVGFQLDVRPSKISDAGDGVFVSTHGGQRICPGTVISLYPGKVYLREFMRSQSDLDKILPDEDLMIMFRFVSTLHSKL